MNNDIVKNNTCGSNFTDFLYLVPILCSSVLNIDNNNDDDEDDDDDKCIVNLHELIILGLNNKYSTKKKTITASIKRS